jgi:hypothetical protein
LFSSTPELSPSTTFSPSSYHDYILQNHNNFSPTISLLFHWTFVQNLKSQQTQTLLWSFCKNSKRPNHHRFWNEEVDRENREENKMKLWLMSQRRFHSRLH